MLRYVQPESILALGVALNFSLLYAAKKTVKSKEELHFEKKQELEKRLLDVNGQLNSKKQNVKCNVTVNCIALFSEIPS